MKLTKRLAMLVLSICLAVPCLSMMAYAADGRISFNDPKAELGEEVLIRVTTKVDAGISNLKYTVNYDPQMLQYVSATNVTKTSDGTLEYEWHANGTSFAGGYDVYIKFIALKEGVTEVTIASNEIKSSYDITWQHGKAVVTVGSGEVQPEENDQETAELDTETENPTPESEETETTEPNTEETETVEPESEEAESTDEELVSGEVVISNVTTITLLSDVEGIVLPERYLKESVTMDGVEYPAWKDKENKDMCILYAVSNVTGMPSLYQYDTLENTYQRFEIRETTEEVKEEETVTENSLVSVLGEYINYVYMGAAALIVILLILVIVLGVKLSNRNSELDEVYDDLDELLAEKEAEKKVNQQVKITEEQNVETQDDVLMSPEEAETEEDDSEVEVEFYMEETIKEFFAEELSEEKNGDVEDVTELIVEDTLGLESEVVTQKEDKNTVEFYDDEDSFYDDLESHFSVNFIDLDD